MGASFLLYLYNVRVSVLLDIQLFGVWHIMVIANVLCTFAITTVR